MKNQLIICIILAVLAVSCISSKDVQKSSIKTSSQVKVSEDINTNTAIKAVIVTNATNTKTTTETIDTNLNIPGSQVEGCKDLQDLQSGIPLIIKNANQAVSVSWDPKTQKIIATGIVKDRAIPLKGKRVIVVSGTSITTEQKNTNTQISSKKDSTALASYSFESKNKQVTYSQKWIFIILAIVAAIAFLGVLAFKFLRKIP